MRKAVFLILFLGLCVTSVFCDGGGGMFYGRQRDSFPFFEELTIPSSPCGLMYYGGYGYGVSRDNGIAGGFGLAIFDPTGTSGIAGGFGGVMNGVRILKRPLNLQIINCAALGGASSGGMEDDAGFFGFFDELTVELGIPITGWFMPVLYAGYQVIGEFTFEADFARLFTYAPVIGVRIGWGDFL